MTLHSIVACIGPRVGAGLAAVVAGCRERCSGWGPALTSLANRAAFAWAYVCAVYRVYVLRRFVCSQTFWLYRADATDGASGETRDVTPYLRLATWEDDVRVATGWTVTDDVRVDVQYAFHGTKYRMVLRRGQVCEPPTVAPRIRANGLYSARLVGTAAETEWVTEMAPGPVATGDPEIHDAGEIESEIRGEIDALSDAQSDIDTVTDIDTAFVSDADTDADADSDIEEDVTGVVLEYLGPHKDFHHGSGLRVAVADVIPHARSSIRWKHLRVVTRQGVVRVPADCPDLNAALARYIESWRVVVPA
jgi:hypothetical protein